MNIQAEMPKQEGMNFKLSNLNKYNFKNTSNVKAETKNQVNFQKSFEPKKNNSRTISKQENFYSQFTKTNKNPAHVQNMMINSNYKNYKIFKNDGGISKSQEKYTKNRRNNAESFQAKLFQNKTMYNNNIAQKQLGRNTGGRLNKIDHYGSTDNK